jgi:FMN phosphatase YigB (HAD superfamily)
MASEELRNVEAFVFDVFGTVVDHEGTVIRELQKRAEKYNMSASECEYLGKEWAKQDVKHREVSFFSRWIIERL